MLTACVSQELFREVSSSSHRFRTNIIRQIVGKLKTLRVSSI